jgi:hypothetical protein
MQEFEMIGDNQKQYYDVFARLTNRLYIVLILKTQMLQYLKNEKHYERKNSKVPESRHTQA